jgi:hypothetical protein
MKGIQVRWEISSPGSTVEEALGIRVSAGRTVEDIHGSQK